MRKLSSHRFPHAICNARPSEGITAATFKPSLLTRFQQRRELGKFRMHPDSVKGLGGHAELHLIYVSKIYHDESPKLFVLRIEPVSAVLEPIAPGNSPNGEKFLLLAERHGKIITFPFETTGGILISRRMAEHFSYDLYDGEDYTIFGIKPEGRRLLFIEDITDLLGSEKSDIPHFKYYALARIDCDLENMRSKLIDARNNDISTRVEINTPRQVKIKGDC